MVDSNFETPQYVYDIGVVLGIICAFLVIIGIISLLLIYAYYCWKTVQLRQEFINSLDEHDKSIIMAYKNTEFTFRKKVKK